MDHIFGPGKGSSRFIDYGGGGEGDGQVSQFSAVLHELVADVVSAISQPKSSGYTSSCVSKGGGGSCSDDDDIGSPNSDSTVLASRSFGTVGGQSLTQRSRIDLDPRTSKILCRPKMDYKDAPSTHYLSPSLLNSPGTARLEAFSPMLSPVRENKSVEASWRSDSFYLAPLPRTQVDNLDLYKRPILRFSSPSQNRPLACLPGGTEVINQKSHLSSSFASQSPLHGSRPNNSRDRVLSPLPYSSLSPMKRIGCVGALKGRSSSHPTNLADGSSISGSKELRTARFRSSRTASAGTILGWSPPGRKYGASKLDASRGSFQNLESRTPTPTGRAVDNKVVQERHRGLESGARSTYFSTKTLMTAASESSVITVMQRSRMSPSTPPNKATPGKIYQTPEEVHLPYYDDFNPSPERRNSRFSITSSLLSTPERNDKVINGGKIYRDNLFQRENSAASTVFSAATNSTGDISKIAVGMATPSTRRVPGVPRLIEATKNTSGSSIVAPLHGGHRKPRTVGGGGTGGAMYSVKSVDMADEERTGTVGKKINPATKRAGSHGSASKIPNVRNYARRSSSYGGDPKAAEAIIKDAKEYLGSSQQRLGRTGKDTELKKHKVGEVPEATTAKTSPKPRPTSTGQKPATGKLLIGQQKNSATEHAGTASFGRSHPKISSNGFGVSNTGSKIRRSNAAGGTEKSYMRPLAKNASSPPHRSHSSGALSTISNKSSTRLRGHNSRGTEKVWPDRKSFDSLERQGGFAAVGPKNDSKTSITAASEINTPEKLAGKGMSEIIVHAVNSPAGSKNPINGGVLVDITGIGCSSNPRTTPVTGRNWFGRHGTGVLTIPRPINNAQKENLHPHIGSDEQYLRPQKVTPKSKSGALGNLAHWLSSGRKSKGRSSPSPPNGLFSPEEVENLMKRLSAQIPQTPDQNNDFRAFGGRYYSLNIPSLDKSPSKDEKDRNPIAVCMGLINTASNEPQSPRRESLLQMSRVMVDVVSKSRDAERAAEEAKMAAKRAEAAFLETRKHLAEMTELMKRKRKEV